MRFQEENWEMFLANNPDPDLEFGFLPRRSRELTGCEHSLVAQEYLWDDEYVADLDPTDAAQVVAWREAEADEWDDEIGSYRPAHTDYSFHPEGRASRCF